MALLYATLSKPAVLVFSVSNHLLAIASAALQAVTLVYWQEINNYGSFASFSYSSSSSSESTNFSSSFESLEPKLGNQYSEIPNLDVVSTGIWSGFVYFVTACLAYSSALVTTAVSSAVATLCAISAAVLSWLNDASGCAFYYYYGGPGIWIKLERCYSWYEFEWAIFGVSCAAFVSNVVIFLLVVVALSRKPVKVNKVIGQYAMPMAAGNTQQNVVVQPSAEAEMKAHYPLQRLVAMQPLSTTTGDQQFQYVVMQPYVAAAGPPKQQQ